ncbi:protein phosphatase 1 regulatory subunit 1B [Electrophorus electricus]|uniref:Protein phosphatase 1 regulatory subunit 1B n=1 Tax=Electrophorus electricus TaxID=8005 RepID=A0A4W4HCW4_ELEEL|nr:protein phosphatase 1 regulatory subunit 1B [Electrophorus electricus]
MDREAKERRKIQFSVPSAAPSQLDPRQVELIRRRRPTPATLFRLTDHMSPEEDSSRQQLAVCENGVLKPEKDNTAIYQPPSLKAVQKMLKSQQLSPDVSDGEDISPDSSRDPTDDVISDQSDDQSACEFTDEEADSIPLHETLGEGDKGTSDSKGEQRRAESPASGETVQVYMQCPEEDTVPSENSAKEEYPLDSGREPPDDTTPHQSDHQSVHVVKGEATADSAGEEDRTESPARGECKQDEP